MKEAINLIDQNLEELKGHYICVSNVHTTVLSYEDPAYKNVQNSAYIRLPDGKPLSFLSSLKGFREAERVTGPDLMEELFKLSEKKGYTHFFYGSTEQTLQLLKKNLQKRYPQMKIVGMYSPPFRPLTVQEDEKIINLINNLKPDFIWVGLGAPKQEYWMYEHKGRVPSLMIGVGAGFDYHAGKLKRAPLWMQKAGLEWLYRLVQEPRRLWKRYMLYNTKFLYYLLLRDKG
ncbi:WecB/TagA/CpsF family glycosyltransferase [Anoxybacillus sp. FSL W8-1294]|uniref:WecB/TagA/CpsF family glycosyltransferase n=1 Tax=Anoxybacillus sp. FSL W8-1294 TaxID=2954655 RepID=UPI0030CA9933